MEGDLELLAEEQVLEEEALAAAQGIDECGQEEPEEFDHLSRIADRCHLAGRPQTHAPLQAPRWVVQGVAGQDDVAGLPMTLRDVCGLTWRRSLTGSSIRVGPIDETYLMY